jgi:spore maturation protein SpmB
MFSIVLFGFSRRVKVYEVLVTAGKEGFQVAVLIIPYLVAIMVAVGIFRASGAMDAIVGVLGKFTAPLGFPPEALPMALIRPLSGTGAIGVLAETMKTYGPDSFIGYLTSTINGAGTGAPAHRGGVSHYRLLRHRHVHGALPPLLPLAGEEAARVRRRAPRRSAVASSGGAEGPRLPATGNSVAPC